MVESGQDKSKKLQNVDNNSDDKNIPKERKKPKSLWGKIWHFLWYEDSVLSWIVNIILAFLIIKFLVYPGLGLALGTSYPIVAVVSESMEHNANLDTWWEKKLCCTKSCDITSKASSYYPNDKISFDNFKQFPLKNGFNKGDIIVLSRAENLKAGDVIVFQTSRPDPIIHRLIRIREVNGQKIYETKGDNNCDQITFEGLDETNIRQEQIIGKGIIKIPWLGWVKISFVEMINAVK